MRGLDALIIGGQHHRGARVAPAASSARHSASASSKCRSSMLGIGILEIVARIFLLGLPEHLAIGDALGPGAAVEIEVEDIVDALHIHGEALEPVGELARDRRAVEPADLLEIGELRHFHAVAPHFPAQPPGAERRAFPVVLDEADVVVLSGSMPIAASEPR